MQIDIKTSNVKPIRNTYKYVEKRFGDKVASRYQEASYDIQEEINFHYRPLWQPEHEIFDATRTVIKMQDWYVLKDPRQLYYGSYTQTHARQQEVLESNFTFVEKNHLLINIPAALLEKAEQLLLPLRHYEWGRQYEQQFYYRLCLWCNANQCHHVCHYGSFGFSSVFKSHWFIARWQSRYISYTVKNLRAVRACKLFCVSSIFYK